MKVQTICMAAGVTASFLLLQSRSQEAIMPKLPNKGVPNQNPCPRLTIVRDKPNASDVSDHDIYQASDYLCRRAGVHPYQSRIFLLNMILVSF